MTSDAPEGLTITGPSALGMPLASTGFARRAYGGVTPDYGPAPWITVRPDGTVLVRAGKVEYGQGIRTGLAVVVADELRLGMNDIEVVLSDTALVPWDVGTFGSQSTRFTGVHMRKAAAAAREALIDLASQRLDLPAEQLECRNGKVVSASDPGYGLAFDELLADEAMVREMPEDQEVTDPANSTVLGTDVPRIDAVERVTGRALFSQDVIRPGMLFACILRPPTYSATVVDVDDSVASVIPGVVEVIRDGSLIAVLAESDEVAERAAELLSAEWQDEGEHISRWDLPTKLGTESRDPVTIQEEGSVDDTLAVAPNQLGATYYIPYVSTVPMEPRAAVAEWDGETLTVWAGTQRPFGTRSDLAAALEIDESQIRVIAPEVGGGFGAKSIYRPAIEAARLARVARRPVRVGYTRAEEMEWATFRPAALITVRSGFDDHGNILAWDFSAVHATGDRPMIGQRGSETPYSAESVRVVVSAGPAPLRPGSYRSLGGAVNHFAREVHVDEIAVAIGVDPVELRLKNLSEPRYRRVLEAAAEDFGWNSAKPPSGRGIGVAIGLDVGSYSAECVELDVHGSEIVVGRVASALDCGLVYNPEGARSQMEGAIMMGLGTALYEGAEFEGGRLLNGSFARYRVPRITDTPRITVSLTGDAETPPTGAGEPGIVPIAPAIANAVFDKTGERLRELPMGRKVGAGQ